MTWRTFGYWFLCVGSALVVAGATGSEPVQKVPEALVMQPISHLVDRIGLTSDPIHTLAMVLGVAAVCYTYLRVWQNMRKSR